MKALLRLPQALPGLSPLTLTASPAMVPLLGAPLIEPLLVRLARTGVTEITLLHECFSTEVSEYFRDGRRLGLLLSHVVVDPGAALENLLDVGLEDHDGSAPILYFEAPGWTSAGASKLVEAHVAAGAQVSFIGSAGLRLAILNPGPPRPVGWSSAMELDGAFDWRPIVNLKQWWDLSLAALRSEASGIIPPTPEPSPGVYTASMDWPWQPAGPRSRC
jgi:hypothetical protein